MIRLFLALAVLTSSVAAAGEDYMEPYRRGFNAYNLFRWERAAEEMRKAIALNPKESGENVRIQLVTFKPYVPHFYHGMSLAKLGRCSEAVPSLRESLRQNVLPADWRRRAESELSKCGNVAGPAVPGARTEPAPPPAPRPNDEAPAAAPASDAKAAAPVPVPQPAPAPVQIPPQPPVVVPAPSEDPRTLATSREGLRSAMERARKTLLAVPKNENPGAVQELRTRLQRADPSAGSANVLLSATRDLSDATAIVERWLRDRSAVTPRGEPPAVLVDALSAYLRGAYGDAVRILENARLVEARDRSHAMLIRAAARHALFVIGRSRDRALETQSLSDLRVWRALAPGASLDARLFSPRFVQFAAQNGL